MKRFEPRHTPGGPFGRRMRAARQRSFRDLLLGVGSELEQAEAARRIAEIVMQDAALRIVVRGLGPGEVNA